MVARGTALGCVMVSVSRWALGVVAGREGEIAGVEAGREGFKNAGCVWSDKVSSARVTQSVRREEEGRRD